MRGLQHSIHQLTSGKEIGSKETKATKVSSTATGRNDYFGNVVKRKKNYLSYFDGVELSLDAYIVWIVWHKKIIIFLSEIMAFDWNHIIVCLICISCHLNRVIKTLKVCEWRMGEVSSLQ